MDVDKLKIVHVDKSIFISLLNNHDMEIIKDESNIIVDDNYLKNSDRRTTFETRLNAVLSVVELYEPEFLELSSKKTKPEVNEIILKSGIGKSCFWRCLRRYLQSGMQKSSLMDKRALGNSKGKTYVFQNKPGRKSDYFEDSGVIMDDVIERYFQEALKDYKSGRQKTLKSVYEKMNNKHFTKTEMVNGVPTMVLLPVFERPTFRQFYYYVQKHLSEEEKAVIKTSKAEVRNDKRLLLSDIMEGVKGPGDMVEIDASDYQEVPYKFDEDTDFMLSKYISDLCLSDITACITDVKQAVVDKLRERGYLRTWNDTEALLTDIGVWKYKGLFQGREEYFANKIFPRKINIAPEGFLPFMIFAFSDAQDLIRVLPKHEQYFEKRSCSVCERESVFTVSDKSICYECVKKDDENHEFARLVDKMSDGEYKAMSEFESLNNEVALLHKKCGRVVHIKPRMFLYGTSRCPCEKVEFDNGFKILKAYQNVGMSIDEITKTTVWNGYKLGQWVSCTRRKAGKNVLTNKQMTQLEEIGFSFAKLEKKWIEG